MKFTYTPTIGQANENYISDEKIEKSGTIYNNAKAYFDNNQNNITLNAGKTFASNTDILLLCIGTNSRGKLKSIDGFFAIEWKTIAASQVNKEDLNTAIQTPVTGKYTSNDRYNGRTESESGLGFWAEYQTALTVANNLMGYAQAKQTDVDDAKDKLLTAIGNLISTDNINTTDLYEAIHETYYWFNGVATPASEFTSAIITLDKVNASTCSPASWNAYQEALDAAKDEMGKLFNDQGKPTEYNTTDESYPYKAEYESVLSALQKAIAGLDELGSEDDLLNAQFAYKQLEILSRRANPIGALSQGDYSTDSWVNFADAADAAAKFLAARPTPQGSIGKRKRRDTFRSWRTTGTRVIPWKPPQKGPRRSASWIAMRRGRVRRPAPMWGYIPWLFPRAASSCTTRSVSSWETTIACPLTTRGWATASISTVYMYSNRKAFSPGRIPPRIIGIPA